MSEPHAFLDGFTAGAFWGARYRDERDMKPTGIEIIAESKAELVRRAPAETPRIYQADGRLGAEGIYTPAPAENLPMRGKVEAPERCRFGCDPERNPVVALLMLEAGCVAYREDRAQWVCYHHLMRTTPMKGSRAFVDSSLDTPPALPSPRPEGTAALEAGLAEMERQRWSLVRTLDGWSFCGSREVPERVESGTPLATAGDVIRMGRFDSPMAALVELGRLAPARSTSSDCSGKVEHGTLVERLRELGDVFALDWQNYGLGSSPTAALLREAAARIEELEERMDAIAQDNIERTLARLEALRARRALQEIPTDDQ